MSYEWVLPSTSFRLNITQFVSIFQIVNAVWWFYFSKCLEFSDSFFFVLRKKTNQLTFLHVYHHSTMFPLWWIGVKFVPSGSCKLQHQLTVYSYHLKFNHFFHSLCSIFPSYGKFVCARVDVFILWPVDGAKHQQVFVVEKVRSLSVLWRQYLISNSCHVFPLINAQVLDDHSNDSVHLCHVTWNQWHSHWLQIYAVDAVRIGNLYAIIHSVVWQFLCQNVLGKGQTPSNRLHQTRSTRKIKVKQKQQRGQRRRTIEKFDQQNDR